MEINLKTPILKGLEKYKNEEIIRFHMPGHYGRDSFPELKYLAENLFAFDVTEVEGTDNLNQPTEMIKESLEDISRIYSSKKSYISVNGSTLGIKVAIDTLIPDGGLVIAARNCHKSVYNILTKKHCEIEYIYPEIDTTFGIDSHIDTNALISLIEELEGKISGVILTYPNYFGRTYDLKAIAEYLNAKDIYLIVDEAHGAHFVYSDLLPKSAIELGATISIQSTHKTLPALTQTALLHLGQSFPDSLIATLEENLSSYQTTSPSYILMASLEAGIEIMRREAPEHFLKLSNWLGTAKANLEQISGVAVYFSQDLCKLGISTPYSGELVADILRKKYKIQGEMTLGSNILFMLGLTHSEEDLICLVNSIESTLKELRYIYKEETNNFEENKKILLPKTKQISSLELANMKNNPKYLVGLKPIAETLGLISSSIVTPYPPGIPILVPGDVVTEEIILLLNYLKYSHLNCYFTE